MEMFSKRILTCCQVFVSKTTIYYRTSRTVMPRMFCSKTMAINENILKNQISQQHSKVARRRHVVQESNKNQSPLMLLDVTAYATADEYKLEHIKQFLKEQTTHTIKKLPEDAMDVLHVEVEPITSEIYKGYFLFREGSIVFWNFSEQEKLEFLKLISRYQSDSYDEKLVMEQTESLNCIVSENKTGLFNGEIHLQQMSDGSLNPLEMLTFSNAISLSVKLAIWEAILDEYAASNEAVLENLVGGRRLNITMREVMIKCGELFTLRHNINLTSNLLDTPDFYWDRSNLEKLYQKTCQFFNIPYRTKVMNAKFQLSAEFMELIRDSLKDDHHTRLELIIIILIMIEVIFGTIHLWNKNTKEKKRDQVENALLKK